MCIVARGKCVGGGTHPARTCSAPQVSPIQVPPSGGEEPGLLRSSFNSLSSSDASVDGGLAAAAETDSNSHRRRIARNSRMPLDHMKLPWRWHLQQLNLWTISRPIEVAGDHHVCCQPPEIAEAVEKEVLESDRVRIWASKN